jgi:hypothetical protein
MYIYKQIALLRFLCKYETLNFVNRPISILSSVYTSNGHLTSSFYNFFILIHNYGTYARSASPHRQQLSIEPPKLLFFYSYSFFCIKYVIMFNLFIHGTKLNVKFMFQPIFQWFLVCVHCNIYACATFATPPSALPPSCCPRKARGYLLVIFVSIKYRAFYWYVTLSQFYISWSKLSSKP